jgi:hypothetical protein
MPRTANNGRKPESNGLSEPGEERTPTRGLPPAEPPARLGLPHRVGPGQVCVVHVPGARESPCARKASRDRNPPRRKKRKAAPVQPGMPPVGRNGNGKRGSASPSPPRPQEQAGERRKQDDHGVERPGGRPVLHLPIPGDRGGGNPPPAARHVLIGPHVHRENTIAVSVSDPDVSVQIGGGNLRRQVVSDIDARSARVQTVTVVVLL